MQELFVCEIFLLLPLVLRHLVSFLLPSLLQRSPEQQHVNLRLARDKDPISNTDCIETAMAMNYKRNKINNPFNATSMV